jgi:hypothetical protein
VGPSACGHLRWGHLPSGACGAASCLRLAPRQKKGAAPALPAGLHKDVGKQARKSLLRCTRIAGATVAPASFSTPSLLPRNQSAVEDAPHEPCLPDAANLFRLFHQAHSPAAPVPGKPGIHPQSTAAPELPPHSTFTLTLHTHTHTAHCLQHTRRAPAAAAADPPQ